MKIEPNYPGEVIILVKTKGQFYWYVSEKELWILDWRKLCSAFGNIGESRDVQCEGERKGFEVLSEENIDAFLPIIRDYQVTYRELEAYCNLHNEVYPNDQEERVEPAFYIDFDARHFYSCFTEPGSYEYFVPDGWQGLLVDDLPQHILENAKG